MTQKLGSEGKFAGRRRISEGDVEVMELREEVK